MSDQDPLRRRLRDADPASRAELPPEERIAMRQAVVRAASGPARPAVPRVWVFVAATACVAAFIAAVAWKLTGPSRNAPPSIAHSVDEPRTDVASTTVVPTPSPGAAIAARHSVRLVVPVPAARTEGTTRIQFVAPEGTRVFWFPNSPNASEVGS